MLADMDMSAVTARDTKKGIGIEKIGAIIADTGETKRWKGTAAISLCLL